MLSWVEISRNALQKNVALFRTLIGNRLLCGVVKANAYGHGLELCAPVFDKAGVDWFGVNSIEEAFRLRAIGIQKPIYILGFVSADQMNDVVDLNCRVVIYNRESTLALQQAASSKRKKIPVHVKVETGNYRQGILESDVASFMHFLKEQSSLELEGISTHFSNIEDTTDHSYAEQQLELFKKIIHELEEQNIQIPVKHCANTAATLLFPETYFDMVRVGIGLYGLCPSSETQVSLSHLQSGLNKKFIHFSPALSWKVKIAQVKKVSKDVFVGYGCTYKTTRPSIFAILPVGYYDGYDRGFSNIASVLIHGKRAPVRGRVCMNIIMADVTDIPDVHIEETATLLGRDSSEEITPEEFAGWGNTIHYEAVSRIREGLPRVLVA